MLVELTLVFIEDDNWYKGLCDFLFGRDWRNCWGQILRAVSVLFHHAESLVASILEVTSFVEIYMDSSFAGVLALSYLRDSNRNSFCASGKASVLGNNARVIPP